MRKYFLLLIIFVSLFYISQNAEAANKNACEICGDNINGVTDTCVSPYSSGDTCYYGVSCQNGDLLDPYKYCMSVGFPNTAPPVPSDPSKLYCLSDSLFLDGYANKDEVDIGKDLACQTCGGSGWSNNDGIACTKNGGTGTCTNGVCVLPSTIIPVCIAVLSISTGGGDPCNVDAEVFNPSGAACKNMNFEVRDNTGNVKCRGITDGNGDGKCGSTFKQTAAYGSTRGYDLYVSENGVYVKKDSSAPMICGGPLLSPVCSAYNGDSPSCSSAQGCHYCFALSPNSCVPLSTTCPGLVNCNSYASKNSCDSQAGKCGWCADSYSSAITANGGVCLNSQDLATKCDSCFYSRSYTQSASGTYCRDKCPSVASSKGYIGGWCIGAWGTGGYGAGSSGCSFTDASCDCKGNKFSWIKNYDGIVNCGECAINANGQDCGGTAEKDALQVGREILGEVFVYGTRYCQPVNNMGNTKPKYPYEDILSCCQAGYPDSASYEYTRSFTGSITTSSYANCYGSSTEGGLVNAKLTYQKGADSINYEINNQLEKKITWTGIRGYQQAANNPQPLVVGVGKHAGGADRMRDCPIAVFVDNDYLGEFGTPTSPFPVAFPKTYLDDGALTVRAYLIDINSEYCSVTDGIIGMSYIEHPVISYSYYSAPAECSDNYDNDRDCLYDCADRDCSESAACAGVPAKKSCGGVCGNCAGVTYNGASTTCQDGVCSPPACNDLITNYGAVIDAYDTAPTDGSISNFETINAVTDFFAGTITQAQTQAVMDFYAQGCEKGAACVRRNPTVTLTPSSQSGSPGVALQYAVSVTNNDNSACGSSTFSLSAPSCAPGWTCTLSASTAPIPGGFSNVKILTVTPPAGAAIGEYWLTAEAFNSGEPAWLGAGYAAYNIGCISGNPVVTANPTADSKTLPSGGSVTFSSTIRVTDNNCISAAETCAISTTAGNLGSASLTFNNKGEFRETSLSYTTNTAGVTKPNVTATCNGRQGYANATWTAVAPPFVPPIATPGCAAPAAATCADAFAGNSCAGYGGKTITCGCATFVCK